VSEPTYAWEVADDYEARFREYEDKVGTLAADLIEERAQRREVGEALVRVTEERDELTEAIDRLRQRTIEHGERHQKIFDAWLRERAQLIDERDEARDEVVRLGRDREWEMKRANEAARLSADALDVAEDLRRQIAALRKQVEIVQRDRLDQDNAALNILVEHSIEYTLDDLFGPIAEYIRAVRADNATLAEYGDKAVEGREFLAREVVRLRTIIVELGAGEAAEPEEQIEALRPEGPHAN
jgi:chromosome segregation ATPase